MPPFHHPQIKLHGVKAKSCAVLEWFYYKVGWMSIELNKTDFATISWLEFKKIAPCIKTYIYIYIHMYIGLGFCYVREQENVFLFAKQLCNFAKPYMMSH